MFLKGPMPDFERLIVAESSNDDISVPHHIGGSRLGIELTSLENGHTPYTYIKRIRNPDGQYLINRKQEKIN